MSSSGGGPALTSMSERSMVWANGIVSDMSPRVNTVTLGGTTIEDLRILLMMFNLYVTLGQGRALLWRQRDPSRTPLHP